MLLAKDCYIPQSIDIVMYVFGIDIFVWIDPFIEFSLCQPFFERTDTIDFYIAHIIIISLYIVWKRMLSHKYL